jgi:glycosyltransferase involved in cell wall biosynthesis
MMSQAISTDSPRLAIVLSHATQYYSPWFSWLHKKTDLCFKVFYLSDFGLKPALDKKFKKQFVWDVALTTGYDWEIVPNTADEPDTLRFSGLRNPELTARLSTWEPDAILLFGYNYNTHLKLIAWARLHRIPLIFRGDSHLLGREHLSWVKRSLLWLLYQQFAAVTYVGEANRRYFIGVGVPVKRLFFAPHAVDRSLYSPDMKEHRESAAALRTQIGLADSTCVVLFAGKLIASKQPMALLESFIQLKPSDTALIFVGDGEEKAMLQNRAASYPDIEVYFLPFANQSEMPSRYLLADLFVLPSRSHYETWGLSINEAMYMGIPCLVSDRVGCQLDLVTEGETGWVFEAEKPDQLLNKLAQALSVLRHDRKAFHTAIAERISAYGYEQTTAGLLASFKNVARFGCAKTQL